MFHVHGHEFASAVPAIFFACLELTDADSTEAKQNIQHASRFCERVGWSDLQAQAQRLLSRVRDKESAEVIQALTLDFMNGFNRRLDSAELLMLNDIETDLFTDATKCLCKFPLHEGLAVCEEEFNLAGKSLAVGLSTAAIFHAMRSVEASLHVMCRTLNISFPGGIQIQDWIVLTEKIRVELDVVQKIPRSIQKANAQKCLAELLIPADGFRLAWRNHVAHAREKYENDEARAVLGHVAEYLRRLSSALVSA
jgi:hypothetical protein